MHSLGVINPFGEARWVSDGVKNIRSSMILVGLWSESNSILLFMDKNLCLLLSDGILKLDNIITFKYGCIDDMLIKLIVILLIK